MITNPEITEVIKGLEERKAEVDSLYLTYDEDIKRLVKLRGEKHEEAINISDAIDTLKRCLKD
jgi:hypothetical protein